MVKTSEMSMELKQELAFTKEELAELEAAKKMPSKYRAQVSPTRLRSVRNRLKPL